MHETGYGYFITIESLFIATLFLKLCQCFFNFLDVYRTMCISD